MAVQTGRTVNKFLRLIIGDSGNGTLREIPINGISAVGVTYDELQEFVYGSSGLYCHCLSPIVP